MNFFRTIRLSLQRRRTDADVPRRRDRRLSPMRSLPRALPRAARHHGGRTQAGGHNLVREDADVGVAGGGGRNEAGWTERRHDRVRSSHVTQHQVRSRRGGPSEVCRIRSRTHQVNINT